MDYLPIFLNLRDRRVVVVGGGRVASRKADLLQRAGARLTIVALSIRPELRELALRSKGEIVEQAFDTAHLRDAVLVIAATGATTVDRAVQSAARERGIPVNVADTPELCDFILPSIVDRHPVLIAVSSGGRAPILARRLRVLIEREVPAAYGRLATYLGSKRAAVQSRVDDASIRLRVWEQLIDGPVAQRVLAGDEQGADLLLERTIAAAGNLAQGEVFLVGAGPGDPDLLTIRALRLMQSCDIVFYDRLVSAPILDLVRRLPT
jgi:uroporphyrin-III C-methyltransferase / precorrin-2 dehydrogenase / sirohydrochlorin ferrochelatase